MGSVCLQVFGTLSLSGRVRTCAWPRPPQTGYSRSKMVAQLGWGLGFLGLGFGVGFGLGWQRLFADRWINVLAAVAGSFALHSSGTSGLGKGHVLRVGRSSLVWQRAAPSAPGAFVSSLSPLSPPLGPCHFVSKSFACC